MDHVRIADIVVREDLYPRLEPSRDRILQYRECLAELPPIEINQNRWLIDGYHRLEAHKEAGADAVPVKVTQTANEYEFFMLTGERNAAHGLPMSSSEKKQYTIRCFRKFVDNHAWAKTKQGYSDYLADLKEEAERYARNVRVSFQMVRYNYLKPEWDSRTDKERDAELERLFEEITDDSDDSLRAIARQVGCSHTHVSNFYSDYKNLTAEDDDAPQPWPDRPYDIIYADPPWQYDARSEGAGRQVGNHYEMMDLDAIKAMDVRAISKPAACLFLWATVPKLEWALETMKAWGFQYVSHWIWDKQVTGLGHWNRGRHELLLIGRKGSFKSPANDSFLPHSIISERRGEHSAKPLKIAELITRLFPNTDRIELFARDAKEGFDAWGNEGVQNE